MARHKSHLTTKTRLRIESLENRRVPTTLIPTTFADGGLGSGSLRDAVLQFNADTGTDDDVIQLEAGTYTLTIQNVGGRHETAGLTGDLNLTQTSHRWFIQGTGSSGDSATIIDASQLQDRVFQIVNSGTQVVFQDLVIQGGLAQENGGNGVLQGTTDAFGGGTFNNGGEVTLDNVVLQDNVARGADAAYPTVNGYSARGAGIYSIDGALTIGGATIANNRAIGGRAIPYTFGGSGGSAIGGGLYASGGSVTISDGTIASNQVIGGHGGDANAGRSSSASAGGGGSGQGGGIYAIGGMLALSDATVSRNSVTGGDGGDGYSYRDSGGHFHHGYGGGGGSGQGGGIYANSGMLSLTNATVSANTGRGGNNGGSDGHAGYGNEPPQGGGLFVDAGAAAQVTFSTIAANQAAGTWASGGGLFVHAGAAAQVTFSTIAANQLTGDSAYGGGLCNAGTLTVTGSTLSGNSGDFNTSLLGGGIYNAYPSTLTVSNSTLSDNSASYGGGIYTYPTYFVNPVTLTNVTLTANRATVHGGGLEADTGSPVLHSTLIAGNFRGTTGTTRDDVYGQLHTSGDYNLIGDGSGMTGLTNGVNGNLVGSASAPIDPLLDLLQYNGGLTKTHALLAGSPALDAGNPNQLGVPDQRGVVRTGGVNIGAYQASATAFVLDAPAAVTAGVPFDVTVTAVDVFGQVAVGYSGTVTFSTTDLDPGVVLPADYTFTGDDGGVHTFSDTGLGETTLLTPGDQMLTVTDAVDATITGSAIVTVDSSGTTLAQGRSKNPNWAEVVSAVAPADSRSATVRPAFPPVQPSAPVAIGPLNLALEAPRGLEIVSLDRLFVWNEEGEGEPIAIP
jgi:hypothetical protein